MSRRRMEQRPLPVETLYRAERAERVAESRPHGVRPSAERGRQGGRSERRREAHAAAVEQERPGGHEEREESDPDT